MGEPIPLSLLVGGKEQKEDLAYLEGHTTSYILSPVQSDGGFQKSPTMTERRGSNDLEGGEQNFPAVKTAVESPSQEADDPNIVSWDGPNDPDNPLNWSSGLKWSNIALVSAITFVTFVRFFPTRYISPTNVSVGLWPLQCLPPVSLKS